MPDIDGFYEAQDGKDGLSIFAKHDDIGLILLDIHMPKMNGLVFMKKLRTYQSNCPVLILTADKDKKTIARMAKVNIQGYILKPFCKVQVRNKIREVTGLDRPAESFF
jgi:response regulator of citrate/malate metabolism